MFPEHSDDQSSVDLNLASPGTALQLSNELEEGEIAEEMSSDGQIPKMDIQIKLLISQLVPEVVKELEATIRTICVPERVTLAEQSAQDWKRMAEMAVRKPELFQNTLLKKDASHPVFLPLKEFLLHPVASPVWRLMTRLNLTEDDINFNKWWKRIHSDQKLAPPEKLARYLEMINMFLATGDRFWPVLATNPTYFSIQRISSELAAMAGWLRASALELHQVIEAFANASNDVAHGSQKVTEVRFAVRHLWPAGYKPENLHFDADPYLHADLYAREDDTQCLVHPQFKIFNFNANEVWHSDCQSYPKKHKLTTPTQYAKRKLDINQQMQPPAKIPFSTMFSRT